ncbi:MAG: Crp/Fnr family transcriptional regulator [Armatimonadota bacterium]
MNNIDRKSPADLVKTFPIFKALDERGMEDVLSHAHTRSYAKDEMLFLDGEPAKGLFLVQSGVVKIYKLSESGREQILALLRPGESVAELPLFDEGPYPASAAAMEDSTVLFISKADFNGLLDRWPRLCRSVIATLGTRLRKMVDLVEDLSLRPLRQRLARFLLEQSKGRGMFHLDFTNEELAAQLGSVRDVISRTLSALQAEELIRLNGRHVAILDREGLKEEGGV